METNKSKLSGKHGDAPNHEATVSAREFAEDKKIVQGDQTGGDHITVGNISNSIGVAIGKNARVIVNNYPPILKASLREVFTPLLEERSQLFAGRNYAFAKINNFLQNSAGGYLAITAPAGFGKTALIAALVNRQREAFAYHFFTGLYTTSQGEDVRSEKFFLQNVVQQMAAWHHEQGRLPDSINELRALYQKYVSAPLEKTRVLVLDGLDEVTTWSLKPYLSRLIALNLHIILTVRDVGQDWQNDYDLPAQQTQHLPLGGLTREDVALVLQAAGGAALEFAKDDKLLDEVVRVAAYQQDESLGADPFYIRFLAEDIASPNSSITPQTLAGQPKGLDSYLDKWWQEIKNTAQDKPARDLLGTLTVALGPIGKTDLEALNPSLVDDWIDDLFVDVLGRLRRMVTGNEAQGYTLAHPRLRDYMTKRIKLEVYHKTLLDYCAKWQQHKSAYALGYYVRHLQEVRDSKTLVETVLDSQFQRSQREVLKNLYPTLADLRLALGVALEQNDFVKTLQCVAAYRRLIRSESLAQDIFAAIDEGDFREAMRVSAHYVVTPKPKGSWEQVLECYLAWEAAEQGNVEAADAAVSTLERDNPQEISAYSHVHTNDLCDALLVRAARALEKIPTGPSAAAWLGKSVPEDTSALLARYPVTSAFNKSVRAQMENDLNERIWQLEQLVVDNPSLVEFVDEERTGNYAANLRDLLVTFAAEPFGQESIDRALQVVIINPYPRYRDNALVALGIASLAVPDKLWTRQRLQRILRSGLDAEGITFTFDLPSQVVQEVSKRGLEEPEALTTYLEKALEQIDRWGTKLRALRAQAAAYFWQGDKNKGVELLHQAALTHEGFAGFMSVNLLSLANRWHEFGLPEKASELGAGGHGNLLNRAADYAERVRDPNFREERKALVAKYFQWFTQPVPGFEAVEETLAATPDPDARRVYKDLVSAQWLASGDAANISNLEQLVAASLSDETTLDTLLARLFVAQKDALTQQQVADIVDLCSADFMMGRPWETGQVSYLAAEAW
jgi:hypothetical protein